MADATVLKTVEGNLVRVRLPSSAPNPPRVHSGGSFFAAHDTQLDGTHKTKKEPKPAPFPNRQCDVHKSYGLFGQ